MKRIAFTLLIAVSVVFLLGAGKSKQTDEFSRLMNDFYAAWNTLDPDKAAVFYDKAPDLVFFDLAPLKYDQGWQQYRDNFKSQIAPTFTSIKLTAHDDLKVIHKGSVALTTLTFHASAKMKDGNSMDFDGRHTLFWEKKHGQWLIVHEHASKPL